MGAVEKTGNCLVVCAAPIASRALERCGDLAGSLIIAADGGYLRCRELGLTPEVILGDFDSAPMPDTTTQTLVYPTHKDDTDCMLAVKEGLARGCRSFTLLGCTGGRLDHTLAAIQSLGYLVTKGARGQMLDETHMLTVLPENTPLTLPRGSRYLSVFAMDQQCTGVCLRGVSYPLENATLENTFPLGVSNRITQPQCLIRSATGRLLVVTIE